MKIYDFKRRRLFSGPHFLGMLFIAAGIFSIASPAIFPGHASNERSSYIGAAAILLGLMVVSSYGGTLIDFDKKRVKDYNSILGYRVGEWAALPNVKRIVVSTSSNKTSNTPNGISPTWSGTVSAHNVFLYSETAKPILAFPFSNKERAVEVAMLLSANLDAIYEVRES